MEKVVKSHLISRFEKAEATGSASGPGTLANGRFKHQESSTKSLVGGTARNLPILKRWMRVQEVSTKSSLQNSAASNRLRIRAISCPIQFGALNAKGRLSLSSSHSFELVRSIDLISDVKNPTK